MANLQYIGARYVPKFFLNPDDQSNDWKAGTVYEALTIVTYNNDSYTSKVPVSADIGDPASNPEYWACTTKYSAVIVAIQNTIAAIEGDIDVLELQNENIVTPEMYGAVADGVTDDSNAVQAAINTGKKVVFNNKQYRIAQTINVPSKTTVDFNSAVIIADVGGNPLFRTVTTNNYGVSGISFHGVDASIQGTADSIFEFNGSDDFSLSPSNYARDIVVDHIHSQSSNINKFIMMNKAVRDVWVRRCSTWCQNGIISNGKCVEIMIDSCLLYINTNGYPLKLTSDLGVNLYNEGWTLVNCTIDGVAGSKVYIADIYTCQFTNNYIGSDIEIDVPTTTTHTRDITINGNVISGNVKFLHSQNVTKTFYANVTANVILGYIAVTRGANIVIADNTFDTYPDTPSSYGIILQDNLDQVVVEGNVIDDTFAGGVTLTGSSVSNICIHSNTYYGSGYGVNVAGPAALHDNVGGSNNNDYTEKITGGTYALNDKLVEFPIVLGKGQKGYIIAKINLNAAADASEVLNIGVPTNMEVPNGTGWSAANVKCGSQQFIEFTIPYRAKEDVSGNFNILNYVGNSLSVDSQSWVVITR